MIRIGMAMALALAALAGCGTDTDQTLGSQAARAYLRAALPGRDRPEPPPGTLPGLTRAAIEAVPEPLLLISIDGTRDTGVVGRIGANRGVETWASADRKTLALRDGVLMGTRGLGADLMAAVAPTAAQLAAGGTWTRVHVTLNGEDQTVRTRFACTAGAVGPAEVVIVERRYATRQVRENCRAEDGSGLAFQNDYWFEGGTKLRQSRQWIGPLLGHVAIRRLSG